MKGKNILGGATKVQVVITRVILANLLLFCLLLLQFIVLIAKAVQLVREQSHLKQSILLYKVVQMQTMSVLLM
jgi:Na+-translocating ferredoxin:NAD+ oxidoreductase RnfA subunit